MLLYGFSKVQIDQVWTLRTISLTLSTVYLGCWRHKNILFPADRSYSCTFNCLDHHLLLFTGECVVFFLWKRAMLCPECVWMIHSQSPCIKFAAIVCEREWGWVSPLLWTFLSFTYMRINWGRQREGCLFMPTHFDNDCLLVKSCVCKTMTYQSNMTGLFIFLKLTFGSS